MWVLFEYEINDFVVNHPFGKDLLIQEPGYIESNWSVVLVDLRPHVAVLYLFLDVLEFFHSPNSFFEVRRKQEASRYLKLIKLKYFVPFVEILCEKREDTDKPL